MNINYYTIKNRYYIKIWDIGNICSVNSTLPISKFKKNSKVPKI